MATLITFRELYGQLNVDIWNYPVEIYDEKSGYVTRGKCAEIHIWDNGSIKRIALSGVIVWNHSRKSWESREAQLKRKGPIVASFNFNYRHTEFMEGPFVTNTKEITFTSLHEVDRRFVTFFPAGCRVPKRPCAYDKHQECLHLISSKSKPTPRRP
ncbi:MAG: hypothetical protein AAB381_00395 [Patescibacteria group bacterium]|mgnify:CR=1 FL=1